MNICFVVVVLCAFISCTQHHSGDELSETFIVPLDTMPVLKNDNSEIPPPPPPNRVYYFPSNFIIDSTGQVFYYQQQSKSNDDVRTDWNTPPHFINLKPKDIIQIPVANIEDFFKLNILNSDSSKRYVAVGSAKDTIQSLGLSKIIKICNEKAFHIRWKFRMMTQEEAIVLGYKKRQEYYNSDGIKWDSTKITIPQTVKNK